MVKRIVVTGERFEPPIAVQDLYRLDEVNPYNLTETLITGLPDLSKISGNMHLAEKFIRAGPADGDGMAFSRMVRYVSEHINEPLELVLDSNDKRPRSIGMYLPKGKMIIVRGDLGEETCYSMRGGSLFVDGDVDQIDIRSGIVYVDGNVGEIYHSLISPDPNKIAIVAGDIGKGSISENFFVFTKPENLTRFEDREDGRVFAVDGSELSGWKPEDLEKYTVGLFQKMLTHDMLQKQSSIESLDSVKDAIGIYKKERRVSK